MEYKFILASGILVVHSSDNRLIWKGMPDNCTVKQIIQMPGRKTCIVLLDPDQKNGIFQNLVAVDVNGCILWKAELPDSTGGDVYLDVNFQGDLLVAHSWSGFKVVIDPESGRILSKEFTK